MIKACLVLALLLITTHCQETLKTCNSQVYCNDEVLTPIQFSGIFNDSKTFVDMPMKASVEDVLNAFYNLPPTPTKDDIITFLNTYFDAPGSDIESWTPEDWISSPPLLNKIVDTSLSTWANELNEIWKQLGRKTTSNVQEYPERHSILPFQNGFIVPGGRFREFYYWDTFWIVDGLLTCGMFDTVNGTLANFVSMIDTFGFIPNGARIYYSERSQPPLFTQMVWSYYQAALHSPDFTDDPKNILKMYLPSLDSEYQFWMNQRSVNISVNNENYILNRYMANSNLPRPEGYTEDISTAVESGVTDPGSPQQIYQDIASGAESGWDFSSRWFSNYQNLTTIKTTEIIPVDLNSILYKNEITLYQMHTILSNTNSATNYLNAARKKIFYLYLQIF